MLSPEDLELLEAALLPALDRHFLRLLAHGLRTLQAMASTTEDPKRLPDMAQMAAWAATQPEMADDPAFQEVFVQQMGRLVESLGEIASHTGQPLLTLEMAQLVTWSKALADARLSRPSPPPG